jgi:polyhydroxybutyrate depolymerase
MRARWVLVPLVITGFLSLATAGCGNSSGGTSSGTGGTASTGTGGAKAGAGGSSASGGAPGSGGTLSTGGAIGTGGKASTGGATGAGGAPGTGGSGANGTMTSGCGATPPALGPSNPQTINVTDSSGAATARQFYVSVPGDYDPSKPYRTIFAWHYAGGSAATLVGTGFSGGYYGVQPKLPEAIYVAGQGLESTPGDATTTGWPNTNGGDIAFLNAMLGWLESNLCVDTTRIMSTGMSYGGIMSDTIGCQMPDVFRAVAVMSGALYNFGRGSTCKSHDVAAWITHGTADTTVDISGDETARDQFLADNHCGATSTAVDPSPCMSYDGCDSGYPVVWCPVDGEGHTIPSFAASAIATFLGQF